MLKYNFECGEGSLFYEENYLHTVSDIDIYMQASRGSVSYHENYPNITAARLQLPSTMIDNLLKDGWYEGLSKGFPGAYSPTEVNRPLVPYGCWHRKRTNSGIFVNLGSNILIEERQSLFKLLATPDRSDTYFCTKALQAGYTSIVTNNPPWNALLGSETIICYGGCGTIRFNTTCPPIETRKGYQAYNTCNCSDAHHFLNCDGDTKVNDMSIPVTVPLAMNRCILETTDFKTKDLFQNVNLDFTFYFALDLLTHDRVRNDILLDRLTSTIEKTDKNNTIILNLQMAQDSFHYSSLALKNISFIANKDYVVVDSMMLYSGALDARTSTRRLFSMKHTYIGVISNFKYFNFEKHSKRILDDARCLKKLGAYFIILIGDFDERLAEAMMEYLHSYVDVIIGKHIAGDLDRNDTSSVGNSEVEILYGNRTVEFHKNEHKLDNLFSRIVLFKGDTYGKVHVEKLSNYREALKISTTFV